MTHRNVVTSLAFAFLALALPLPSQAAADHPTIEYLPRSSPPPVPEGLNVTCANAPNFTALAKIARSSAIKG
jgi:hypothetical protein